MSVDWVADTPDDATVVDSERTERARPVVHELARDVDRYLAGLDDPPHDSLEAVYETGTVEPSAADWIEASGALDVDVDALVTPLDDPARRDSGTPAVRRGAAVRPRHRGRTGRRRPAPTGGVRAARRGVSARHAPAAATRVAGVRTVGTVTGK